LAAFELKPSYIQPLGLKEAHEYHQAPFFVVFEGVP